MLICQCNADLQPNTNSEEDSEWTQAAQVYSNLEEMPTFITQQHDSAAEHSFTSSADSFRKRQEVQKSTRVHPQLQSLAYCLLRLTHDCPSFGVNPILAKEQVPQTFSTITKNKSKSWVDRSCLVDQEARFDFLPFYQNNVLPMYIQSSAHSCACTCPPF